MTQFSNPKKIYRRFCNDCGVYYQPNGRYQKYCEECKKKRLAIRNKKATTNPKK